ncbi:hypothetical protein A4A49_36898, partial [Nicotiana attenuata]
MEENSTEEDKEMQKQVQTKEVSDGGQQAMQDNQLEVIDEVQEVIQLDKVSPGRGGNQGKQHSPKKKNTRAFGGNEVGLNTSCQDIPSQRVEGELAKNIANLHDAIVLSRIDEFQSNDRVQCQEIPSQATDPEEIAGQQLLKQKVNWTGGKLWSNQTEEDPDEGDLSEGYEEEKIPDVETQGEEVSINGNNTKGDEQLGEKSTNMTDAPMEIVGSNTKINPSPTPDPTPAEPIDPGDPNKGKEQQIIEKDGLIEQENQNDDQLSNKDQTS